MKLRNDIYQIRIDFSVTEQVQRYVYVYLIMGRRCYLIDSGVRGSERKIFAFMEKLGRRPEELEGVFLTHAHPDHMGAAAAIKAKTGCRIYASEEESPWIENVELQYEKRPIPNFYRLAGSSVSVNQHLKDGDQLELEPGMQLKAIDTKGHSKGDLSFLLQRQHGEKVLFTGDAIPEASGLPIFIDWNASVNALDRIAALRPDIICPAWDQVLEKAETREVLINRKNVLQQMRQIVLEMVRATRFLTEQDYMKEAARRLGTADHDPNPLFCTSVRALHKLNAEKRLNAEKS